MYSGLTLTRYSGCILGAHQRFDRVAYKMLLTMKDEGQFFPTIKSILHFEGKNGPDAIKRKSPGRDEPRHFYNPFDEADTTIVSLIHDHYTNLVKELKAHNSERAAFEASWLAHTMVDGLTPAHHFPYDEAVAKIRGEDYEVPQSIKKKWIPGGENRFETLKNTWKLWGAKGLLMTHGSFEMGVATLIVPARLHESKPDEVMLSELEKLGLSEVYQRTAREIAKLNMFDRFVQKGWTGKLASEVRHELAPRIVQMVVIAWFAAVQEAAAGKPMLKGIKE